MSYTVHSLFLTVQGEGANIGRTAVFIRFAGCNLTCAWCDTDFQGGKRYADAAELADAAAALWPPDCHHHMAVLTGGEPLLQADKALIDALRERQFYVAVETNGTQPMPPHTHVDWICVSPKAGAELALNAAHELKLVYPQPGAEPERYAEFSAVWRWLSPMDAPRRTKANMRRTARYCLAHPEWRLAIQAHKTWGLP